MATVTLTLTDNEAGDVDFAVDFGERDPDGPTGAQRTGHELVSHVVGAYDTTQTRVERYDDEH